MQMRNLSQHSEEGRLRPTCYVNPAPSTNHLSFRSTLRVMITHQNDSETPDLIPVEDKRMKNLHKASNQKGEANVDELITKEAVRLLDNDYVDVYPVNYASAQALTTT